MLAAELISSAMHLVMLKHYFWSVTKRWILMTRHHRLFMVNKCDSTHLFKHRSQNVPKSLMFGIDGEASE